MAGELDLPNFEAALDLANAIAERELEEALLQQRIAAELAEGSFDSPSPEIRTSAKLGRTALILARLQGPLHAFYIDEFADSLQDDHLQLAAELNEQTGFSIEAESLRDLFHQFVRLHYERSGVTEAETAQLTSQLKKAHVVAEEWAVPLARVYSVDSLYQEFMRRMGTPDEFANWHVDFLSRISEDELNSVALELRAIDELDIDRLAAIGLEEPPLHPGIQAMTANYADYLKECVRQTFLCEFTMIWGAAAFHALPVQFRALLTPQRPLVPTVVTKLGL